MEMEKDCTALRIKTCKLYVSKTWFDQNLGKWEDVVEREQSYPLTQTQQIFFIIVTSSDLFYILILLHSKNFPHGIFIQTSFQVILHFPYFTLPSG